MPGANAKLDRWLPLPEFEHCPFRVAAAVLKADHVGRRRIVSGRGRTREDAVYRTNMEAYERWSAVYPGQEACTFASFAELESKKAIDPRQLLLFSDRQVERANKWNARIGQDHWIPPAFRQHTQIPWVKVTNLETGLIACAPAPYCFLSFPYPFKLGFCAADSSGLAAGESREEAIQSGLLELIERDAVAVWWYNCLRMPSVSVPESQRELLASITRWLKSLGRELYLINLTTDLMAPVVAAVAYSVKGPGIWIGTAAGLDIHQALESSLGELCQFMTSSLLFESCFEDANNRIHFLEWARTATLEKHPHLRPLDCCGGSVGRVSMDGVLSVLKRQNLEGYVLDLSPNQAETSAVRILVPGLRPIAPRFAPGRLYSVPIEMGWLQQKKKEQSLNSIPIIY
ncbi:YcaO-like family protein [Rhizobium sp. RAF56]|uniref:YcaO-like family protein n=1 Tax=Rhizobium sp. RAF56 TaxID=3233062 RepID=UPI003F9C29DE